eukprot:SAG22_NODE_2910_length_2110_cov_1.295375_4_plen_146_part_00
MPFHAVLLVLKHDRQVAELQARLGASEAAAGRVGAELAQARAEGAAAVAELEAAVSRLRGVEVSATCSSSPVLPPLPPSTGLRSRYRLLTAAEQTLVVTRPRSRARSGHLSSGRPSGRGSLPSSAVPPLTRNGRGRRRSRRRRAS